MDRRTVLLIEDNEKLNEINRRALENEGYEVLTAHTLAAARRHLSRHDPDVILLDVVLPDGSGMDLCEEIRQNVNAHILFLTSRREHDEKIRGLSLGGDDYITKPFKLDELLARVRAVMRRRDMDASKLPARTVTHGPLALDTLTGQAFLNGADMQLAQKEAAVLRVLMESSGKALSKETLYQAVWNQPMIDDDRSLKNVIYRLRRKLEADKCGLYISNMRGEGYRLDSVDV